MKIPTNKKSEKKGDSMSGDKIIPTAWYLAGSKCDTEKHTLVTSQDTSKELTVERETRSSKIRFALRAETTLLV